MDGFLKQSTAVDLGIGPFLDDADGVTPLTALTIAQADVRLKKNNGAWAQVNDATSATHEENGWYEKEFDATDTNTLGILRIAVHESGALPVWHVYMVLAANVYDSLFGGTDTLDVQVTGIGANVITATAINADAFTAAKFAADVTTEFQSGLATAAALATVDGNVDAILLDTAEIGAAGAGLTAVPWNAAWDAEVQSEVADALGVYDPPTKAELDTAVANVSVDEIQATALADLFNTDSGTTYASAVAGSPVKEIADNAGGSALTEAGIADAVWDEALAGHLGAGSTGEALDAAGGGVSAADIADAVWDEALAGHVAAGSAGEAQGLIANVEQDVDDLPTNVWAAGTRTLTAGTNIALAKGTGVTGFNDLSAAQVNAEVVDAINTDTYAEPGSGAPAATASLAAKIGNLHKHMRNKKDNDGTENKLYGDDGSTVHAKQSTTRVGSTYTVGEWEAP